MEHYDDLIRLELIPLCVFIVESLVDTLDLKEMVASTKSPQLRTTTLLGHVRDLGRVSTRHLTVLLGVHAILLDAIAILHSPFTTVEKDLIKLILLETQLAFRTDTTRDVLEKGGSELTHLGLDLRSLEVGTDHVDTAVYVKTSTAGTDDTILFVKGTYCTHGQAITDVGIRHRTDRSDNTREHSDIRELPDSIIFHDIHDSLIGEYLRIYIHALSCCLRKEPFVIIDSL